METPNDKALRDDKQWDVIINMCQKLMSTKRYVIRQGLCGVDES